MMSSCERPEAGAGVGAATTGRGKSAIRRQPLPGV